MFQVRWDEREWGKWLSRGVQVWEGETSGSGEEGAGGWDVRPAGGLWALMHS